MKRLQNYSRIKRLIEYTINSLSLDLSGMSVLTEAASGSFVVTALIAALAGADEVIAVTKDSRYGTAKEVIDYTQQWAKAFKIQDRIQLSEEPSVIYASKANLITNLGFVRPIDCEFINRLSCGSAISLMCEPWEVRESDVDISACNTRGVPVLGTSEVDPRLQIFRYVGLLALKLLLQAEIEVFKSRIAVIGSGPFGEQIEDVLCRNGANVLRCDPTQECIRDNVGLKNYLLDADALIVAEYRTKSVVLGGDYGMPLSWILNSGTTVVHISGTVDEDGLKDRDISKIPSHIVRPGFMSITTDYVGPRPVIELHSAGLKVGEALVRGMRKFNDPKRAIQYALHNSPAMEL